MFRICSVCRSVLPLFIIPVHLLVFLGPGFCLGSVLLFDFLSRNTHTHTEASWSFCALPSRDAPLVLGLRRWFRWFRFGSFLPPLKVVRYLHWLIYISHSLWCICGEALFRWRVALMHRCCGRDHLHWLAEKSSDFSVLLKSAHFAFILNSSRLSQHVFNGFLDYLLFRLLSWQVSTLLFLWEIPLQAGPMAWLCYF